MNYAPLYCALACAAVLIGARLRTNQILSRTLDALPARVSAIYLLGLYGLVACGVWAFISDGWRSGLIVTGIYGLTWFVPSVMRELWKDPKVAHLAAIEQAGRELAHLSPGTGKCEAISARADEIMRAGGWARNAKGQHGRRAFAVERMGSARS